MTALLANTSTFENESLWVQRTHYTETREIILDGKKRLEVRSKREGAPFSPGHTSLLLLNYEQSQGLCVGSILDVDLKKSRNGKGARQITGGMLKNHGPNTDPESFIDGAREEALAETGFLASLDEMYPVCRIVKSRFPGRDLRTDQSSGTKTTITQTVFARFGDAAFIQTDDSDARDPRWDPLSHVFDSGEWFASHVVIVTGALRIILEKIELYEQGLVTDTQDLQFFEKMLHSEDAQKGANESFEVAAYRKYLKKLKDSLDLQKICLGLYRGDHVKSEEFLSRFQFFPLGSKEYFEDNPS